MVCIFARKIVEEFQNLEVEFSKKNGTKIRYFKKKFWKKKDPKDGGGQYYILRNGQIFDKVGVNHSTVEGVFQKNYKSNIPGTKKKSNLLGIRNIGGCTYEKSKNPCCCILIQDLLLHLKNGLVEEWMLHLV